MEECFQIVRVWIGRLPETLIPPIDNLHSINNLPILQSANLPMSGFIQALLFSGTFRLQPLQFDF